MPCPRPRRAFIKSLFSSDRHPARARPGVAHARTHACCVFHAPCSPRLHSPATTYSYSTRESKIVPLSPTACHVMVPIDRGAILLTTRSAAPGRPRAAQETGDKVYTGCDAEREPRTMVRRRTKYPLVKFKDGSIDMDHRFGFYTRCVAVRGDRCRRGA